MCYSNQLVHNQTKLEARQIKYLHRIQLFRDQLKQTAVASLHYVTVQPIMFMRLLNIYPFGEKGTPSGTIVAFLTTYLKVNKMLSYRRETEPQGALVLAKRGKTETGRQYFTDIIGLSSTTATLISLQSYRIWVKNAK